MSGDLNVPFEPSPEGPMADIADAAWAGGVVVLAMVADIGGDVTPCLAYRFAKPDGSGFHPPMILVLDNDEDAAGLIRLTRSAVFAATAAAKEKAR